MRFALCLRGIHYINDDDYKVDYRLSVENYKKFLIEPLRERGITVDIFVLTYTSEHLLSMIKEYNPVASFISPGDTMHEGGNWKRQLYFHIASANLIQTYEKQRDINYDYIITTRFDLIFKVPIYEQHINQEKFNITYKNMYDETGNCDDNFWLFPRRFLSDFEKASVDLKINNKMTHEFNHYFPTDYIHYMFKLSKEETYNNFRWKYFEIERYMKK
jgi:hypothetical protein